MRLRSKSKSLTSLVKIVALTTFGLTAPMAVAAGDMLTPDEVKTTGISANPANDSGLFVGAGARFGQSRSTDGGSSPGIGSLLFVEPGYQANTGSWSRFEISAELFTGSLDFRLPASSALGGKSTLSGLNGGIFKVGHGYSLGSQMFGVLKAGVGLASTVYEAEAGATKVKSDRTNGLAWTVGWQLVAPLTSRFDFTAGVDWTQFQFDVDFGNAGGSGSGRQVLANLLAADVGLRFRF
ncbi:MAG: hypothetical protein FJ146_16820 [Deltaproteobacteria bacterium]|nr:hypothetical protein [Deltaproteobacteria bacterium]